MRNSRAKALHKEVKTECLKMGLPFKTVFRRMKKEYNRTPRTERTNFTIYEK